MAKASGWPRQGCGWHHRALALPSSTRAPGKAGHLLKPNSASRANAWVWADNASIFTLPRWAVVPSPPRGLAGASITARAWRTGLTTALPPALLQPCREGLADLLRSRLRCPEQQGNPWTRYSTTFQGYFLGTQGGRGSVSLQFSSMFSQVCICKPKRGGAPLSYSLTRPHPHSWLNSEFPWLREAAERLEKLTYSISLEQQHRASVLFSAAKQQRQACHGRSRRVPGPGKAPLGARG